MDQIKNMIVKFLSRAITREEFEQWLYYDNYVNDRILFDDHILELLSINLRAKSASLELEKYLNDKFEEEDCLIEQVKVNCEVLMLSDRNPQDFAVFIGNLSKLHDWTNERGLLTQIYWFQTEWDLANDGYSDRQQVEKEILVFATEFLQKLHDSDKAAMIEVIQAGIKIPIPKDTGEPNNASKELHKTVAREPKRISKWFKIWNGI